jgi:hypothetical protein
MATERQIEANRRNAKKSTGPKTEDGKARSRLNALTHGLSARTVTPVLPHEDPKALDERIRKWVQDWQPRDEMENELVTRAAKLSWQIDRADRFETAHLARRVRKAQRRAAGAPDPRRIEEVTSLGRRLLKTDWTSPVAVLVAELESTSEGCRWLLDRWAELEARLSRFGAIENLDLCRFFNLLGKKRFDSVTDPVLNALLTAWDVLQPGTAKDIWDRATAATSSGGSDYAWAAKWRELAPRPVDPAAAMAFLFGLITQQVDRLNALLAEHARFAEEETAGLPDRAAFDLSAGFERQRRYRTALGRELLRSIDTLRKLRKDAATEEQCRHDPDLTCDEESSDNTGSLSQEKEGADKNEGRSQDETETEKAPKEAKLPLSQHDGEARVVSHNDSARRAKRTEFPERLTCDNDGIHELRFHRLLDGDLGSADLVEVAVDTGGEGRGHG